MSAKNSAYNYALMIIFHCLGVYKYTDSIQGRLYERHSVLHSAEYTQLFESTQIPT